MFAPKYIFNILKPKNVIKTEEFQQEKYQCAIIDPKQSVDYNLYNNTD